MATAWTVTARQRHRCAEAGGVAHCAGTGVPDTTALLAASRAREAALEQAMAEAQTRLVEARHALDTYTREATAAVVRMQERVAAACGHSPAPAQAGEG